MKSASDIKKIFEKFILNLNEGVIIYDAGKNEVIIFNDKARHNFGLNQKKYDVKERLEEIIENVFKEQPIDASEVQSEVFCDITRSIKWNLLKIIHTGIDKVYFIKIRDISHIKKSEKMLNDMSYVFKEENKIVAVVNKDATFEYANDKFAEAFELDEETVEGKSIFSLGFKQKDFQNIRIWKTIAEGNVWTGEIQTTKRNGEDIFLKATITPVKAAKNNEMFVIFAEDISSNKYYEIQLKKEERKKKNIINALPDTIFVISSKGIITEYKSEQADPLVDKTPIVGENIDNIGLPEDFVKKIINAVRFCLKAKKLKQFNYEMNSEKIFETRIVAINEIEVVCIIRNVTKRILGEKLLKNKEKSYKNMVESFPSGIIIHKNNRIVYCNKTALKYLGCKDFNSLRKYNVFDLIPEEYREKSKERLEKVLAGRNVQFMEFPIMRLSDKKHILFETKPVLFDFYGEKVCQIVIRDMSIQKRLIKETIRAEIAEKGRNEMKQEVEKRIETEQTLKASLKEKELLIKEIHHRVKNNMQVMTSILNLQANSIKDDNMKKLFEESQNRIKSMALVHENIYDSKDFSNISFKKYADNLIDNILRSYDLKEKNILLTKKIHNFYLPVTQSVPCGLIINEIISLSIKRFLVETSKKSYIFVEANIKNNEVQVIITDNAKPIKNAKMLEKEHSLSYLLIMALIDQLNGTFNFESKEETIFNINFNI